MATVLDDDAPLLSFAIEVEPTGSQRNNSKLPFASPRTTMPLINNAQAATASSSRFGREEDGAFVIAETELDNGRQQATQSESFFTAADSTLEQYQACGSGLLLFGFTSALFGLFAIAKRFSVDASSATPFTAKNSGGTIDNLTLYAVTALAVGCICLCIGTLLVSSRRQNIITRQRTVIIPQQAFQRLLNWNA